MDEIPLITCLIMFLIMIFYRETQVLSAPQERPVP